MQPAVPRCYHGYWDWCKEQLAGINIPSLSSSSKQFSGGRSVSATENIPSTTLELVSSTDFDNWSSAVGVASNPSWILSHSLEIFFQNCKTKLGDKIQDRKPGFEATGGGLMLTLTPKFSPSGPTSSEDRSYYRHKNLGAKYAAATYAMSLMY